jgi:hypothetical protein
MDLGHVVVAIADVSRSAAERNRRLIASKDELVVGLP